MELARLASVEQDREKLLALAKEINRLLQMKEARLREQENESAPKS
jgi:hypothetical protein